MVTIPEIVAELVRISDEIQECFDSEDCDRHFQLEITQAAIDELADKLRHV